MFFTASFISAALAALSAVKALPQVDNAGLEVRAASCDPGYYRISTGCVPCPPGNTCSGNGGPAKCGAGHANPNTGLSGVCPECPAGTYMDTLGGINCIQCPKGSWAAYPASPSCKLAPSGWFQSMEGQTFRCGTCCGWETKLNGNILPTNCTGTKPYADKNSGNGCVAQPAKANCVHAATCEQDPITGACPLGSLMMTN
ncbi:hypothetical protein DFH09DRAFT_1304994 [Mycena vulgaris]|nr:hypothetical protein DFH09DRAFT_1304994 [Mycena vulgaris]